MALPKYTDILAMAKDKIKEVMAPLRANEMKKKGELEIAKLEGVIAEKEQKIQELAAEFPIVYERLIDAMDDLALSQRRRDQLQKILLELFP